MIIPIKIAWASNKASIDNKQDKLIIYGNYFKSYRTKSLHYGYTNIRIVSLNKTNRFTILGDEITYDSASSQGQIYSNCQINTSNSEMYSDQSDFNLKKNSFWLLGNVISHELDPKSKKKISIIKAKKAHHLNLKKSSNTLL